MRIMIGSGLSYAERSQLAEKDWSVLPHDEH